jgi:hypothetical protein
MGFIWEEPHWYVTHFHVTFLLQTISSTSTTGTSSATSTSTSTTSTTDTSSSTTSSSTTSPCSLSMFCSASPDAAVSNFYSVSDPFPFDVKKFHIFKGSVREDTAKFRTSHQLDFHFQVNVFCRSRSVLLRHRLCHLVSHC